MISTSLLFTIGRRSVIEWCKRLHARIFAKGQYFEHLVQIFTFFTIVKKIK